MWSRTYQPSLEEARTALVDEFTLWINYVCNETCSPRTFHNGMRDAGREAVTLEYFLKHANAIAAELSPAHVLALRIYTTHLFKYLNGPLRDPAFGYGKTPHPLPITMAYLNEGGIHGRWTCAHGYGS